MAHGIGTSEVEHVLATQTLIQKKGQEHEAVESGPALLQPGVTAKDITLAVIGETGTAGGTGYVIEYMRLEADAGDLSMEGRMTALQSWQSKAGARGLDRAGRNHL